MVALAGKFIEFGRQPCQNRYPVLDENKSAVVVNRKAIASARSAIHAQFDVVVTDYAMPGMTGLDLATKIREMEPNLPIIIATGYADLPPHATLGFPRLNKP
jgi:CheY-like chemotaxis protein